MSWECLKSNHFGCKIGGGGANFVTKIVRYLVLVESTWITSSSCIRSLCDQIVLCQAYHDTKEQKLGGDETNEVSQIWLVVDYTVLICTILQ